MENNKEDYIYNNGYSLPEMFVLGALVQITDNDNIVPQYSPEWADKKRYDFYLKKENAIIEVHGLQHFEEIEFFKTRTLEEEQENDAFKEQLAKEHNINKYVQLDCSISHIQYMYDSIFKNEKMRDILSTIDKDWEKKMSLPKINEFIVNNKHGYKDVCKAYLETYQYGRIKSIEEIKRELQEKDLFLSNAAIDNCLRYAESSGMFRYYTPSMYKGRDIEMCSELFDEKHKTIDEIRRITNLNKNYINKLLIEGTEKGITKNYRIDTNKFNNVITLIDNKVDELIKNNKPLAVSTIESSLVNDPFFELLYKLNKGDIYSKGFLKQQFSRVYFQDYMSAKAKIGDGKVVEDIIKGFGDDKQKMVSPVMIANKLNINIEIFYRAIKDNHYLINEIDKACRYPATEGHTFHNDLLKDCIRTAADMICSKGNIINENNLRNALNECNVYPTLLKEYNAKGISDLLNRDDVKEIIDDINYKIELAKMTAEYTAEYEVENKYLTVHECAKQAWVNDSVVNNNPSILASLINRNIEIMKNKGDEITVGNISKITEIAFKKLNIILNNEEYDLKEKIVEAQKEQQNKLVEYINKRGKETGKYKEDYIYEKDSPYKMTKSSTPIKAFRKYIIDKECAEMIKNREPINYQNIIKNTGIHKDYIYESHGILNGSKAQITKWANKQEEYERKINKKSKDDLEK